VFQLPNLYDHQKQGVKLLAQTNGVGALFFEPGLGKSATTLTYLAMLAASLDKPVKALVLAPKIATDTWVKQTEQWGVDEIEWSTNVLRGSVLERARTLANLGGNPFSTRTLSGMCAGAQPSEIKRPYQWSYNGGNASCGAANLAVVNLETFSQNRRVGNRSTAHYLREAAERYEADVLICDESHLLKAHNSNVQKLVSKIARNIPRRVLLTGTPMPLGYLDLYGQWNILRHDAFGESMLDGRGNLSWNKFSQRYAKWGGFENRQVVGYDHIEELQDIIGQNSAVARKSECLDLPPVTDAVLPFHLNNTEQRAYDAMLYELCVWLSDNQVVPASNKLSQLVRLRQLCSGFIANNQWVGTSKVDTIIEHATTTLAQENRICIFSYFVPELLAIVEGLKKKGENVELIYGETSQQTREKIRARFGDTTGSPQRQILVAQSQTISMSVNELVSACHVIYGSLSLRRDTWEQSRDRLNRIGQERPVTVWITQAADTVDEVIYANLVKRGAVEDGLLEWLDQQRQALTSNDAKC